MVRGKSLSTATAVSLSPSGAPRRYRWSTAEQKRRVGKEQLSVLVREYRSGTGDRHDEIRLRAIAEGGTDEVDDRSFRRAHRRCGPNAPNSRGTYPRAVQGR